MDAADEEAIAAAQRRIEIDEELTRAGDERDVVERNRPDRLNPQSGRRRCRGGRSGIGESSEERERPAHIDPAALDRHLRVLDAAAEERPEAGRQARLFDRDLARRADCDSRQLEADARQQPRDRRADRHRMAEGGRGLRFDRRLDAVAAKKNADRQRQRDEDTEEDRRDDDETLPPPIRRCGLGRGLRRSHRLHRVTSPEIA